MQELAFNQLHRVEEPRLRRFFRQKLRDHAAAADAIQETFLRFFKAIPRSPIRNPGAYLFQIARNVALATLARAHAEREIFIEGLIPEHIADHQIRLEERLEAVQRLRLLMACIDDLPPRCREVFVMSRFDGLTNQEIADRAGMTKRMVEKHIARALLRCSFHA